MRPGQRLGQYELICQTAQGGMASVWLARSTGPRGFKKVVAIKTMLPAVTDDPQAEQMFLAEAAVASRIDHPNVAQTLDLCEEGGALHQVMEWVGGETLGTVYSAAAARGGMPLSTAVRIVSQVAAGLHAAHELADASGKCVGLVHRDISPQNVLVGFNGVVKIVDFGIAKLTTHAASRTEQGELKGKIPYMAPEQIRLEAIDRRVDIFATGILLYLLTTGRHPFKRGTPEETAFAILSEEPVEPPSRLVENYSPRLERVLARALAKNPADRYATARELGEDLLRALPSSFKGSGHDEVRTYVQDLLPAHFAKHRDLMRVARDASEHSFESAPITIGEVFKETRKSSATLRAVAVSAHPTEPPPGIASSSETGTHAVPIVPRAPAKVALAIIGGGLCVALGFVALTRSSPRSAGSEAASAKPAEGVASQRRNTAEDGTAAPDAPPLPPGTAAPIAAPVAAPPAAPAVHEESLPVTTPKSSVIRPRVRVQKRPDNGSRTPSDGKDLKDPY